MEPQSQPFTPFSHFSHSSDSWRWQNDLVRLQQVQAEHADRISRLERKQEDDARMKSVWGNQSPFPSVLSGTPQQAPLQHPPGDQFRTLDEEATHLMSSLHLDADDEPRRALGAASRANSVRFDESANQNHFSSHSSRPSVDLLLRSSSRPSGLQMSDRTSSHKFEGRASSAHSVRSLASGRASSLNLDTGSSALGEPNRSPLEAPSIAPGVLLLGPAPAIIRCWMNTNFKHDALLYAAVCTGSYKSYLDLRLIQKLGFEMVLRTDSDGTRTVKLPMYFPEAVPQPPSFRSSSPAPSLPSLLADFRVMEHPGDQGEGKAIQIFLGSDVLRAHDADIMFSSNSMTIFDDDRNKLSIPFARPENESVFNGLHVTSVGSHTTSQHVEISEEDSGKDRPYLNGLGQSNSPASVASSAVTSSPPRMDGPPGAAAPEHNHDGAAQLGMIGSEKGSRPASRASHASRPSLNAMTTKPKTDESQVEGLPQANPLRPGTGLAIWSNWRRDGANSTTSPPGSNMDWASISRNRGTSYQRKDTGIKVLKPKTASRNFSSTVTAPTLTGAPGSPVDGKSRFFDEGRRRSVGGALSAKMPAATSSSHSKENAPTSSSSSSLAAKTKANPIGGATAFSWLSSGGSK